MTSSHLSTSAIFLRIATATFIVSVLFTLIGLHSSVGWIQPLNVELSHQTRLATVRMNPVPASPASPDQTQQKTLDFAIQTKTKKSTKASALSKGQKKKGGSVIIALVKMARPLNSFIAFRSYYAVIFINMPQKVISGFLTHLWQADPTKAKWAILAKAYSEIRDKIGKKRAPLPPFLAINAPFVGVIDPDDYLRILGWELIDRDGQTILRRAARPDGAVYEISMITTNASVEDVISNSYHHGYINQENFGVATLSGGMSVIMATSAQPVGYPSFDGLPIFNTGDTASTNDEDGDPASPGPTGIDGIASEASNSVVVNPGVNPTGPKDSREVMLLDQAGTRLLLEKIDARLRASEFDFDNTIGKGTFQPDVENSSFDPFKNDQFDAFDLSDMNCSKAAEWTDD